MRICTSDNLRALRIETLEPRQLMSAVAVDATDVIRTVGSQVMGVNLAWWDTALNTSQTKSMVQAAGLTAFRLPGGSSADAFHFATGPTYYGEGTAATFAQFVASVNGIGMVTVNYGTGSPQEAAAWLAYLNASPGDTTVIGNGQWWKTVNGGPDPSSSWVQVNWQTAGYWASLRASTPLAQDDGLNFLRIGHAAPFNMHYFEIGNEEYGSWEIDQHGSGGDTGKAHDPATYVAFAKQFQTYANEISPGISIGVDGDGPDTWMRNVLRQSVSQGFTPGFISDHNYMYGPGQENDATLLLDTISDPSSPLSWASRSAGYRGLLSQYMGAAGNDVELLGTEFNSVYSGPGKQSTSLVNGLFVADSLGAALETSYDGTYVWDLRNGWDTSGNMSSSLYGWRQGGDYGLIGSSNGPAPSTGTYVPYPGYFAEQLVSKMAHSGDSVVQASSSDPNLAVYAVRQQDGDMDLLVINKSSANALTGTFNFMGFEPTGQATVWQYGETQDTAQSHSGNGSAALANFTQSLTVSGASVSESFPAYSMTVLDLQNTPPAIVAESLAADGKSWSVQFSSDVSGSVSPANLNLVNQSSGIPLAAAAISVSYNAASNTAVYTFPGIAGGVLDSGQYIAELSGIANRYGQGLATQPAFQFLWISPGATLKLNGGGSTQVVQQLTISPAARLDLGGDTVQVEYAAGSDPAGNIQALLASAYAQGKWTGPGIFSSQTAGDPRFSVGYFDDGQDVKIAATTYGDANLQDGVNADDFSLMMVARSTGQTRWQDGNFNYDNTINADDWMLLALGTTLGGEVTPLLRSEYVMGAKPQVATSIVWKSAPPMDPTEPVLDAINMRAI